MSHPVKSIWDTVKVGKKAMPVYVSVADSQVRKPAVIVLQEIYGVNSHIRDVTERIAKEGYHAFAPDLFYRQGERFESGYVDNSAAYERMKHIKNDEFLEDIKALVAHIRAKGTLSNGRSGETIPVGVVGFCMGGRLTYLAACSQEINAAVSYYGGGIAKGPIDRTADLVCPIMLFYGGKDKHIPQTEIDQVKVALEKHDKQAGIFVYPEADHGFFCNERRTFNAEAAEDSWIQMRAFFKEYLGK